MEPVVSLLMGSLSHLAEEAENRWVSYRPGATLSLAVPETGGARLGIRKEQQTGQRSPPTSFTLEESLETLAPCTCSLSSAAPAEKCRLESQGLPQPSVHSVPRLPGSQRTGAFTG